MTNPNEELAHELGDISARLRSLFRVAGRGGESAVDLLGEVAHDVDRIVKRLKPTIRSVAALPATEGRFTTGTIAAKGRMVRVEIRNRRRVA